MLKVNIHARDIREVTSNVIKAKAGRTTLDALKTFKIETNSSKNQLKITAANEEMMISQKTECVIEEDGCCCVPMDLFNEVIGKFNEPLVLKETEKKLNISSAYGTSKISLTKIGADGFPRPSALDSEIKTALVPKEVFLRLIEKTAFAVSADETKGVISGVLFEINEGNITAVALDGFRMSVCSETISNGFCGNLILSGKVVRELLRVFSKTKDDEIKITTDSKQVRLETESIRVTASLMTGTFISYRDIFPQSAITTAKMPKSSFFAALERASVLAKEDATNRHKVVKLEIGKGGIEVSGQSETGTMNEAIPGEVKGEELTIGFNSRYLHESLKELEAEEINFEFSGDSRPLVIKEGETYRQLILPVRLR